MVIIDEVCRLGFALDEDERDQADCLLPPEELVHLDLEGPPGSRNRAGLE